MSQTPAGARTLLIGLANIVVDMEIQSRVEMLPENILRFSEDLRNGFTFHPVVVFFDGVHYWLADGFHRMTAYIKVAAVDPAYRDIACHVFEGSRQDAIAYSAGANIITTVERTKADIQRACDLLFALPTWTIKSHQLIASHVRTSVTLVKKYRAEFHERTGTPYPDVVESVQGVLRRCRRPPAGPQSAAATPKTDTEPTADRRPVRVKEKAFPNLSSFFTERTIAWKSLTEPRLGGLGIFGALVGNHVATWTPWRTGDPNEITAAVGRLVCLNRIAGGHYPWLVLCNPHDFPPELIEAYRGIGIAFMHHEDFAYEVVAARAAS